MVAVDNLRTGSERNIGHLRSHPRFSFMERGHRPAPGPGHPRGPDLQPRLPGVPPSTTRGIPSPPCATNFLGALNLLELARRSGARFLQASTSEVYGDPLEHPQSESYWGHVNPIGVRSCYDEGKRCAEALAAGFRRQHGADIRIVRIFNTYGPRMSPDDGRVVSNFIVQALRGEPLTVYGTGDQTRSFCYVDDLIGGIDLCMETEGYPGPVNLGNPRESTVRKLAREVIRISGSSSPVAEAGLPEDDPRRRCPDIGRALGLGWRPRVPLEEGLERTISWFRNGGSGAEEKACGTKKPPSIIPPSVRPD